MNTAVTTISQPGDEDAGHDLLEVFDLKKHFLIHSGFFSSREMGRVRAVDGISFSIKAGKTLALVGESGCGKSTVGRLLVKLLEPTEGSITLNGVDLAQASQEQMQAMRRQMQMVFQDPYSSLNPRMKVGQNISEALIVHGLASGKTATARVEELMRLVGLDPQLANRLPQELSGGQRQRVGIARALAVEPDFIICDEAISALDVSVQAQVINLLVKLQRDLGLAYLFIAHDLAVVRHIADDVAVMYLGRIVELANSVELFAEPLHPYTRGLIAALPVPDPDLARERKEGVIRGELPSPLDPPSGCHFHPRCPYATPICAEYVPKVEVATQGRQVACHHWLDIQKAEADTERNIG
ncbi:ABC transporter ATP-binding protein [Thalassospira alkalitolerans]|uniref:ABC transporter ATP-binding protein n=1 Tax=Thalassospira alkalitolerans TaxID=1293890 RepID=UPI003AA8CACE